MPEQRTLGNLSCFLIKENLSTKQVTLLPILTSLGEDLIHNQPVQTHLWQLNLRFVMHVTM